MSHRRIYVGVVVLLFCTSCVSAFEAGNAIRSLQQKFDTFFVSLQRDGGSYEQHAPFYAEARLELAALRTNATIAGADDVDAALRLIEENLSKLEEAHRAGLDPSEVPLLRDLFVVQFNAFHRPKPLTFRRLALTEV